MNKDLQKNPVPTISGESIDFSNAIRVSGLVGLTEESLFKKVLEQTHIAHKEEKSKMIGRLINSEKWKFSIIDFIEIKKEFEDHILKSDVIGICKKIGEKIYFFINCSKKNIKDQNLNIEFFFSPSDFGFTNQILIQLFDKFQNEIIPETKMVRFAEYDFMDLYKCKNFTIVLCEHMKPKVMLNYNITYEDQKRENEEINIYNDLKKKNPTWEKKIHTLAILDNPYLDKFINKKEDHLKISWAQVFRASFTSCELIKKCIPVIEKAEQYFNTQIENTTGLDKKSFIEAKKLLLEILIAKDKTEMLKSIDNFYNDHTKRAALFYIFFNSKTLASSNIYYILHHYFTFYMFSSKFTDYGLKMPCLELSVPYEIKSHEIDWENLPDVQKLGFKKLSEQGIWTSFYSAALGNQLYNGNMFNVLDPWDFPLPPEKYPDIFKFLDIEDDIYESEKFCSAALDEARAYKNSTLNNGSYFIIDFGPFSKVQLFEIYEDIEAKFITEEGFFYMYSVNTKLLTQTSDSAMAHYFGSEKTKRILLAMKLIVCALVRDYWVVEKKESIFQQKEISAYFPRHYNSNKKPYRVVYLPRVIYEKNKKPNIKKTYSEMEYEKRSRHAVRAHVRLSKKISPIQIALAKKYQISVPDGYTFVKPHYRGDTNKQQIYYKSKTVFQMLYKKEIKSEKDLPNKYFQFEVDVKKFLELQNFDVVHWSANKRNDGGKDLIATKKIKDQIITYLIQCKCYSPKHKIDEGIVRDLVGSMVEYGDKCKGIIITTSDFTKDSIKLRDKLKNERDYEIEFINGNQLGSLIHN